MGINEIMDEGQINSRAPNWEQLETKTAKAYEDFGEILTGFGLFSGIGSTGFFFSDYTFGKLLMAVGVTGASVIACQLIKPGINYINKKRQSDNARNYGLHLSKVIRNQK
jgi:hypothetical protein